MGAGDILSAIIIGVMSFFPGILPRNIIVAFALYLIIKGLFFGMGGNFISFIDVFCGVYIILLMFGVSISFITLLIVLYLMQKNVALFFS